MTKAQRHAAIRERAASAIRDLYHNATPRYPSLDDEPARIFEDWFQDAAQAEIEYLQDGGAYGKDYRKTLEAPCNAGQFRSSAARAYYVRWKMQSMREERARCNSLDSRRDLVNSQWERIGELGKLHTYGRGGRTLAPADLVRTRGGSSFGMREDYCDERPIADCVDLVRIVESFNACVAGWCKGVPEMWAEYWNEYTADVDAELEPTE